MVMVAVRAKGALWNANASLFVSLAVGVIVMNHGPSMVERRDREFASLYFRGRANAGPS